MVGDEGIQIQNQADGGWGGGGGWVGGGGGVGEHSRHCGQIIKKIKILIENTGYTPNFRF